MATLRGRAALRAAHEMASEKPQNLVLVGEDGFEPSTSALSEPRSNQLSYPPIFSKYKAPLVHKVATEPIKSAIQLSYASNFVKEF